MKKQFIFLKIAVIVAIKAVVLKEKNYKIPLEERTKRFETSKKFNRQRK